MVLTTSVRNYSPKGQVVVVTVNVTPSVACASFLRRRLPFVPTSRQGEDAPRHTPFSAPQCEGAYKIKEASSNAPGSATETLTVN